MNWWSGVSGRRSTIGRMCSRILGDLPHGDLPHKEGNILYKLTAQDASTRLGEIRLVGGITFQKCVGGIYRVLF